ncbi:hypothetical protein T02_13225 [Trichinella nativa]|uniref:Uncharacterized protein n=1 Tax=Trichinella nativa TaxID=6335 RepID=A0A0V1L005_9BILA|nr:hypothetical protein T02_13225 [Trichinella nativa]
MLVDRLAQCKNSVQLAKLADAIVAYFHGKFMVKWHRLSITFSLSLLQLEQY